jgi:translocation protein SEC63
MAPPEEMSALFPIFLLSMMALVVIPWTVTRVLSSSKNSKRPTHCPCSLCKKAPKNQTSVAKQVMKRTTQAMVFLSAATL